LTGQSPQRAVVPMEKKKMSSTSFEPEPYHTFMHNRLPEDEPSGSKHVEDIIN
jgi:hypothetical protein